MDRPTRSRLPVRLALALFGAAAFLLAPAPSALAEHARTRSDSGRHVAGADHGIQTVGHRGHSRHRGYDRRFGHSDRGRHDRYFGHRDRSRHDRHFDHRDHHYGKHYKKHPRRYYGHSYGYGDYYGHHGKVRVHRHSSPYYCAPCSHYFRSRYSFHDHIHSRHHVPLVRLPFVIVRSALGWIFYG